MLVVLNCVAAAWLWRLGAAGWARIDVDAPLAWIAAAPTDAVMALLRLAALCVTGWWLTTAVLYGGATLLRGGPSRWLAGLTPAATRRVADACLTATLAGGMVAVPAVPVAAAEPATRAPLPPFLPQPSRDTPERTAAPEADGEVGIETHAGPTTRDAEEVTVVPGDSLWHISARVLGERRGVPPSALPAREIARWWHRVVELNRGRLPSGDPDLIRPGETVLVPTEEAAGGRDDGGASGQARDGFPEGTP